MIARMRRMVFLSSHLIAYPSIPMSLSVARLVRSRGKNISQNQTDQRALCLRKNCQERERRLKGEGSGFIWA